MSIGKKKTNYENSRKRIGKRIGKRNHAKKEERAGATLFFVFRYECNQQISLPRALGESSIHVAPAASSSARAP